MFNFFRKNKDDIPVIEKIVIQNVKPRHNELVEYSFFKKSKTRKYSINMYAKDVPAVRKGDRYTMVAKYSSDPLSIMYIYIGCKKKETFTKANLFVSAVVENGNVLKNNVVRVFPIS